jgi:hypothetical protein
MVDNGFTLPESASELRVSEVLDPYSQEFSEAYALYEQTFPEGERETLANVRQWILRKRDGELRPDDYHLLVARLPNGNLAGLASFHYIHTIKSGFLGYLVVPTALRSMGIGGALFAHVQRSIAQHVTLAGREKARGIYMELDKENPDVPETYSRFRFWKRQGTIILDIDWRYPALHNGQPPASMYLAYCPLDGNVALSFSEIKDAVRAIYGSVYRKEKTNGDLLHVITSIEDRSQRGQRSISTQS